MIPFLFLLFGVLIGCACAEATTYGKRIKCPCGCHDLSPCVCCLCDVDNGRWFTHYEQESPYHHEANRKRLQVVPDGEHRAWMRANAIGMRIR